MPGWLHLSDLSRLNLDAAPHAPWAYFSLRRPQLPQAVELLLPVPVLLLALRDASRAYLWLPLGVCLFPFWEAGTLDLGYRLSLAAPLLAALLVASGPREWPRFIPALVLVVPLAPSGFHPAAHPPYGVRAGEWPCAATWLGGEYWYTAETCREALRAEPGEELAGRLADERNPTRVRPGWMIAGR